MHAQAKVRTGMQQRILASSLWLLVIAAFITTPLLLTVFRSKAIVEVTVTPISQANASVLTNFIVTEAHGGPAYFDFEAELRDAGVNEVLLRVRPVAEPTPYTTTLTVQNGRAWGTVPLGSERWPLTADEEYSFQLLDGSNQQLLMAGRIAARVTAVAIDDPWLIAAVSLLAAVIEIVRTVFRIASQKPP